MNVQSLSLVSVLLGHTKEHPTLSKVETDGNLMILTLRDAPPHFRHTSAEFLDGWTWHFSTADLRGKFTTIALNRKKREATVTGVIGGIQDMALTVQEIRTVGLPCSNTRPMIRTEAGIFMLHPQLRAKVGNRIVCSTGCGVCYLSTDKEIESVQISFGQHWSASQAEPITALWDAND